MKAVIQRVLCATVLVDGATVGAIGPGLLVLLGVAKGDGEDEVRYMVEKLSTLRIFSDQAGKMNLAVSEAGGSLLVVSQFTLLGDTAKGRRPGFDQAAPPELARALYEQVVNGLKLLGLHVATGRFGAHMAVELVNDGPVTLIVDSGKGRSSESG
ncbi:MAG: D-tyrosyl-tRNA(Tyr) deacylase [Nitrospirae bacterium]|nr:MAG: D-tyrosyl-tRNA(Tyr) deacylase [Nitrospirota bacterium]